MEQAGSTRWRGPAVPSSPWNQRFFGLPNEIKPTEGAVGAEVVVRYLLYRGLKHGAGLRLLFPMRKSGE